jgi:tetratricopeptide (TPR) repeat protein
MTPSDTDITNNGDSQVFKRIVKTLTCITVVVVIGVGSALAQAQPAAGQPQWKDQAEYDLFKQVTSTTDAAKRLPLLDSWKEKYPDSAFKKQRLLIYQTTYQGMANTAKAVETAKEILTLDPNEPNALYFLTNYGQILPPTADSMATGEKAAHALLALDKAPEGVDEAAWKTMKPGFAVTALTTLGMIATQKKQYDVAEQQYVKALEIDPAKAASSYGLGSAILAQQKPERYPEALFHLARAASLTGPGALPAAGQKQVDAFLVKSYTKFHGQDDAGLKELRQLAVGPKPMPPAGFTIKNVNEIEAEKAEKAAKENPQLAFWKSFLKDPLVADNGAQYFEGTLKGAAIPGGAQPGVTKLSGKLIETKPAVRPKELILDMDNDGVPDVTLKFETALPGKAEPGTVIHFEGVPSAFTKTPFMLTFDVEGKDKITGWPAQSAPAPVRRAPAKKGKK